MLIKRPDDILPSEITPRALFERRRAFIKAAGALALAAGLPAEAWAREAFPGLQKSPLIAAGFTPFVLLIPLAATSNAAMLKRLGGRRWTQLHRSAYAIAIIGVIHYWWLVKKDITLPLLYTVLLGALLGWRALRLVRERQRQLRAAIYESG